MADNSTPAPGTPPASTPASGTGTEGQVTSPPAPPPSTPPPPETTMEYWKQRHNEATATITRTTQQNTRYRELYGEIDNDPPPTPAGNQPSADVEAVVQRSLKDWEIDQQVKRIPSLLPHLQEVKDLVGTGKLTMERAMKIVAEDHNIVLSPTMHPEIELMPTIPSGGGAPPSSGSGLSSEHEQQLAREGGNIEAAKKLMPVINRAWNKALRR